MVAEGTSPTVLQVAVGHLPGTALPGHVGNIVFAAHRDTLFLHLGQLKTGDVMPSAGSRSLPSRSRILSVERDVGFGTLLSPVANACHLLSLSLRRLRPQAIRRPSSQDSLTLLVTNLER